MNILISTRLENGFMMYLLVSTESDKGTFQKEGENWKN